MLPANARLRRSEEFRAVLRGGVRAGRRRLVLHALPGPRPGERTRAGFVVSKAVGNSVVRHRVTRRLRHLVADRLGTLPEGSALVVRALPPAATATSAELGSDLDAALRRLNLLPADRAGEPAGPRHRRDAATTMDQRCE
ncbi:ribonuclease P protein component [Prauserella shujinwangii]|uniref:Ribonuclease P protein component n=1 Tax=Prauserella shujinwangii TaxID=1453103 RepID=A0A2T0LVC3_9PSEU|nr:ribonuclease P protein component [Prauserella shujinwangii]PRX47719.1 ribonuclease P protein component [Prauserella shujinwangii]